ncbi:MAG: DUF2085 domain-containing protein [Methanobacteriota archaeon]
MAGALLARLTWSKALLAVLALNLLWTGSLFLAPFTVAPGSFYNETRGGANVLDFASVWGTFHPYARLVYTFGDVQCHQLAYRSFELNGNQLPIDARMTSMYVFANLGLVAAAFAIPASTTGEVILNGLPSPLRRALRRLGAARAGGIVVFVGLLPIGVDGFTQLLTPYESTNLTRVLTGAPGGFVGGLLVGAMLVSLRQLTLEIEAFRNRLGGAVEP